jgi:hypothetical protein
MNMKSDRILEAARAIEKAQAILGELKVQDASQFHLLCAFRIVHRRYDKTLAAESNPVKRSSAATS